MANDLGAILRANNYPGRGIVLGKSADGASAVAAYFIMGRSENSRNRVFIEDGEGIRTQAFDSAKCSDPSLIIYSPVRVLGDATIVTNGDQTDTVYDYLSRGDTFECALATRCFEPDKPNYTPRISGLIALEASFFYKLSIIKAADADGSGCNRFTFSYAPKSGLGHFIHTYEGDGEPLPSFKGEPSEVIVGNDIDEFTSLIWDSLNEANKVSLFVRYINIATGEYETRIVNKNV